MTIHFSSAGSYDIDGEGRISFTWDFNDGTDPSTLANPEHEYEDPGTYEVVLTVIDQKSTIATAKLILTVQRNYGDTDIIMKALESDHPGGHTYVDPEPGQMAQVAVMRTGWVAYLCDIKDGQEMEVTINIIGERPVDVYLFREVHFQTYKRNPQVTFVPFEATGYKQGATGEHKFNFKALETDRYYIVIDNKDWPLGTDTEGPVDYTLTVKAMWEDESPGFGSAVTFLAMLVVVAVAVIVRYRRD
jgi:PKD repeat protein